VAFQQHADERMQEVQVLWRGLERERIDRVAAPAEAKFEVPASKECRQLPVAVAEIEDDGERVVLLRMRCQKVDQEALAGASCAQDERVADVFDVQIERVRRVVRRLEYGKRLSAKVTAGTLAWIQREQEAQVRRVRLEDGKPAEIVSAV